MHIYICPYCDPCATAILIKKKAGDLYCKYDKEDYCIKEHKCKEIMICKKCRSEFRTSIVFKRKQKRKIKDG